MSRRKIAITSLACFVIAFALVLFWLRDNTPKYYGLTLWQWADAADGQYVKLTKEDAATVIREIGTNALPVMLKYLHEEDRTMEVSKLKSWMYELPRIGDWLYSRDSEKDRDSRVQTIFHELGDVAEPAIPELVLIINRGRGRPFLAMRCLAAIGDSAFPAIDQLLKSKDPETVWCAAHTICDVNSTNIAWFIPALAAATTNQNMEAAESCVQALVNLRLQPEISVPALANALSSTNYGLRSTAVFGLGHFAGKATNALPRLEALLLNAPPQERLLISNAIWHIKANDPLEYQH